LEEQTKPIRVRIQNEGQPGYMTRVTDVETGKELAMVKSADLTIRFDASDRNMPVAHLTVYAPVVDVIADADIKYICPCCGCPVAPPLQGDTADDDPFALDPKL